MIDQSHHGMIHNIYNVRRYVRTARGHVLHHYSGMLHQLQLERFAVINKLCKRSWTTSVTCAMLWLLRLILPFCTCISWKFIISAGLISYTENHCAVRCTSHLHLCVNCCGMLTSRYVEMNCLHTVKTCGNRKSIDDFTPLS